MLGFYLEKYGNLFELSNMRTMNMKSDKNELVLSSEAIDIFEIIEAYMAEAIVLLKKIDEE